MSHARSTLRTTLITFGALLQPGLGHIAMGRWWPGVLLFLGSWLTATAFGALALWRPGLPALGAALALAIAPNLVSVVGYLGLRRDHEPTPWAPAAPVLLSVCVAMIVVSVPVRMLVRDHLIQAFRIPSESMAPTLIPGDFIFADRRVAGRDCQPGDLVVFRFPMDRSVNFVFRVVGIGGDVLEIRDRVVYRNGNVLEEPFVRHTDPMIQTASVSPRDNFAAIRVPEGQLFVLGDQRENSNDSRYWGFVPASDVLGRITGTYWSMESPGYRVRWERVGKTVHELEQLAR